MAQGPVGVVDVDRRARDHLADLGRPAPFIGVGWRGCGGVNKNGAVLRRTGETNGIGARREKGLRLFHHHRACRGRLG